MISLRGFHATPHVNSAPCHPQAYRLKGQLRIDTTIQRAYTAQLAATDLDPYTVCSVVNMAQCRGAPVDFGRLSCNLVSENAVHLNRMWSTTHREMQLSGRRDQSWWCGEQRRSVSPLSHSISLLLPLSARAAIYGAQTCNFSTVNIAYCSCLVCAVDTLDTPDQRQYCSVSQ